MYREISFTRHVVCEFRAEVFVVLSVAMAALATDLPQRLRFAVAVAVDVRTYVRMYARTYVRTYICTCICLLIYELIDVYNCVYIFRYG